MFRSRVARSAVALLVLSAPAGIVAAGSTEPPDSVPDSTPDSAPDSTTPDETASTAAADASAPPSGTAPEGSAGDDGDGVTPPSPEDLQFEIDMMLGLVPQDEMEQHWADQEEQNQLTIQACMNESGFDYQPESMQMESGMGGLEWGSPEFAEQYGFGIWTTMDPDNSGVNMTTEYTSPNQEMLDGLTPEEQNAWYQVQGQCMNDVYSSQDDIYRNPDVQQIMEDFYTDIENDPRMREAQDGWVDCMEAAGFPYPSQEDMYEDVNAGDDETYELHNRFFESEAWEETSEDHAEWQALVDREIEVAVANAGCEPAITETREEVQRDLRDDLVAVFQTIDWSQPPVTYEGEGDVFVMPGESLPLDSEEAVGTDVGTTDDGSEPDATDEPQVGLDLGGDPAETTAAP